MPTPTYKPIANISLGANATSVTFSGISQTYKDYILAIDVKMTNSGDAVRMQLNGDTASNYSTVWIQGGSSSSAGSSESSQTGFRIGGVAVGLTTTNKDTILVNIMDATSTDKHKTTITRYSGANTEVAALAGRWASLSAVNAIRVYSVVGSLAAGTTVSLYGVIS